jgi:TolB-like protein/Tfp pilus assembly protein PilF
MLFSFDNFMLDTDRRELRGKAGLIDIEPQVFDLLVYLIRNRDRVVSKDDILAAVWEGRIVSESALTTRINSVRNAIADSGDAQRLIKTFPRKGIRFVGEVREEQYPTKTAAVLETSEQSYAKLPLPNRPSIAVLPFSNLSGDPEQDYFADGMAEEIITSLSQCNWLFVIARNSSFTYKGKSVDVRRVGRELGVRYVLEGSVRRAGNHLRLLGQLVDTTSGAHIWADRFDGELTDVFALQDRFTESIVAAIEPTLQFAEIERLKRTPAANLDAYDLLLRAHQYEFEFTAESLTAAIRCSEQALAIDPHYVSAMALSAYCYGTRVVQGWSSDAGAESAKGAYLAARAAELGRTDASVLWMAAHVILRLVYDRERATELAYASLELNPNSAIATSVAGIAEIMSGHSAKGMDLLQRAQRLNPRDPRGWLVTAGMALAHFSEGRYAEAVSFSNRALSGNPRFAASLRILTASYALLSEREKAAEALQRYLKADPLASLSTLQLRLRYLSNDIWSRVAEGLQLAGLGE